MADIEVTFVMPDVCFSADASIRDCQEEWNPAPVVVMAMTVYWDDISREISWVMLQVFSGLAMFSPARPKLVVISPESNGAAEEPKGTD